MFKGQYKFKEMFPKKWYGSGTLYCFEDSQLIGPEEYDKVLTQQYGDYMTPVKAPSYHGGFWALTADKSYQECLREKRKDIIQERVQGYLKGYLNRIRKQLRRFGCSR